MSGKKTKKDYSFIARMEKIIDSMGSQSRLSTASGVSQTTISSYLHGGEPSRVHLISMAKASGVSVMWLAIGEGEMSFSNEKSVTGSQIQQQELSDFFDQAMDEFFEMVKIWQVEKNGRTVKTAIAFTQEFPLRFPEMTEWLKKRGGGSDKGRLQEPVDKVVNS
ncbi:MAG: helix-turn-helix domain-containing protein [Desulfocapsaceae bacterium]|nr:helix-turn-helix domain-containing protein [Desulfocapsaceae bacterium]